VHLDRRAVSRRGGATRRVRIQSATHVMGDGRPYRPGDGQQGLAVASLLRLEAAGRSGRSKVSGAKEIAGSQVGSQRGATLGDTRPRPAIIGGGERHIRRCQATSGDGGDVLWEQEAAGSNPAIPTYLCWSGRMQILLKIVCEVSMGAKRGKLAPGGPPRKWPQRGPDLDRTQLGVLG
jgi:hypothetical protein